MSTHIIDRIAAVRVPAAKEGQETLFIMATYGGDNNVIEQATNRRARDWSVLAVGSSWHVMRRAIITSSDMEGGSLRLYGSRKATAETFIRRARKVLKEAPDFRAAEVVFRLVDTRITFSEEERQTQKYYYDKLVGMGLPHTTERRRYGKEDVQAYAFDTSTLEGMRSFLDNLPHNCPFWHHMDIRGLRLC